MSLVTFKNQFFRLVDGVLYGSGAAWAYRRLQDCNGAVILMYHTVADREHAPFVDPRNHVSPAILRQHLTFLAARRHVVSLDRLVAMLADGQVPPRGTVVITFDDGYRDNLTVAAPLLAERELPATLYLASAYVDRAENQWIDQIHTLFAFRSRDAYQPPGADKPEDLRNPCVARSAYRSVCRYLLTADPDARAAALSDARAQLQPAREAPRLTLNWDEVRTLRREYPDFTLGAHSHEHLDLSTVPASAAEQDMRTCTETIHSQTGERPRHFSYPYGRRAKAYDNMLKTWQYRSAVASGSDALLCPGANLYDLARVEAPPENVLFRYYTSGAYPGLSRRLTGRPR